MMEYFLAIERNEMLTDTHYNMVDLWNHYAEKPDKKGHILCEISIISKPTEAESRLVIASGGGQLGMESEY